MSIQSCNFLLFSPVSSVPRWKAIKIVKTEGTLKFGRKAWELFLLFFFPVSRLTGGSIFISSWSWTHLGLNSYWRLVELWRNQQLVLKMHRYNQARDWKVRRSPRSKQKRKKKTCKSLYGAQSFISEACSFVRSLRKEVFSRFPMSHKKSIN